MIDNDGGVGEVATTDARNSTPTELSSLLMKSLSFVSISSDNWRNVDSKIRMSRLVHENEYLSKLKAFKSYSTLMFVIKALERCRL